jgi:hypothetical protein
VYFDLAQTATHRCKFFLSSSLRRLLKKDNQYKVTWLKQAVRSYGSIGKALVGLYSL